mgnify:CR=1 FL=1
MSLREVAAFTMLPATESVEEEDGQEGEISQERHQLGVSNSTQKVEVQHEPHTLPSFKCPDELTSDFYDNEEESREGAALLGWHKNGL